MSNDNVAPINHSAGSAIATTASSTASGVVGGGVRGFLKGIRNLAILGGAVALIWASFGTGLLVLPEAVGSTVLPAITGKILSVLGWTALGTAIGGGLGVAAGWITVPFGAILGGAKGAARGSERVSQERGQAAMLEAQVQLAKAQAPVYSPYAAQGSPMNAANSQIQVGRDMQYDGPINGQLALAR